MIVRIPPVRSDVPPANAIVGGKPQISVPVLQHAVYIIINQRIFIIDNVRDFGNSRTACLIEKRYSSTVGTNPHPVISVAKNVVNTVSS
jgi:hypothetical protein